MVNMAVQWAGPNGALATLAKELNARFGPPTRFYEYVTGYKSPSNVSGHNADNNGIGHGMDIFVGAGHNISVAQGIDLAERLRLEGKKGTIPGHPDRLAYIIHRGRIAGDHTNWEWVAYNGIADHYDHIHISSVFDYFWGDVVAGHPLDYNSTAAWNLWATSTQGGNIKPIQEDTLSAKEVQEIKNHINAVMLGGYTWGGKKHYGIGMVVEENQRRIGNVAANVWATPVARGGKKIPALQELADTKTLVQQTPTLSIDYDKLATLVAEKLAGGIEISGSLTAGKGK